jgi:RNA polymerase sigma factor for flagellar operon FliA
LQQEASLWRELQAGSQLARTQLFDRHAGFARGLALRHFRQRTGSDIELEDLKQLAYAGLLEALGRFDPDRGAPFRAFAARRITGSILDGVAKSSELREQLAHRRRIRRARVDSLATGEVAALSAAEALAQLSDLVSGLALGFMLDKGLFVAGEDEADDQPNAYQSLAWRQLTRRVVAEVRALPERERIIIEQHYGRGVDFQRLGQLLGVTKGRISQIHKDAVQRLRRSLGALDSLPL